jgi:nucleoside-diphosphate-sugar epimerase
MKFLVTGGSGFLGQDVISRLLADGNEVVLLGRTPAAIDSPAFSFQEGDITDIATLQACRKKYPDITTVVHLAALVPKSKDEDIARSMCDINVCGTINLLDVFGESLHNFVYASTAEVYGLPATDKPIQEDMLALPLSNYGASKLSGEQFCRVFSARYNLPISMLRFTVLYGPGDRIARAIPNFIQKALRGEQLEVFGGQELRDYLHVTDAARAVYLAAKKPVSGVFNIGTGKGITIKETAEKIVELVGNPDVTAAILPREKKAADIVLDVTRAKAELGFTAEHTFPDLLKEQIVWHKSNQ